MAKYSFPGAILKEADPIFFQKTSSIKICCSFQSQWPMVNNTSNTTLYACTKTTFTYRHIIKPIILITYLGFSLIGPKIAPPMHIGKLV